MLCISGATVAAGEQATAGPQCRPTAALARLPELPEASGLAASRRTPGRFWSHNDSGEPVLFALDGSGKLTGMVQVTGADVEDWEAIAIGPCPDGSCLYIGDIGDNEAERERITIYRLAEPAVATGSAEVTDVFHATYPDGPQDAESLLITSDGRLHVVTKGDTSMVSLYRFPGELRSGHTVRLERVGAPGESGRLPETDRITDAAVSPDDRWVVLRSTHMLTFFRAADLFAGNWQEAGRLPLAALGEPQGEGVSFGPDDSIYLAGEGGGDSQPGTFMHLSCTFER